MSRHFATFASKMSMLTGKYYAFLLAAIVIVVWALAGPLFGFSNTWQLVINTGTTIITFLMVFLIQNTQNRENTAIHLKLDEIIRAIDEANDELIDAEEMTDEALDEWKRQFHQLLADHNALRQSVGKTAIDPPRPGI